MTTKHYPILFTFIDKVSGNGFLAKVTVHGRALAADEGDGWWMYGVEPGDLAEGGASFAEAQAKFRMTFSAILFDTHYQGLTYGPNIDNLQPLPTTEGGVDTAADTVWPEFDRPMIGLSGAWDTDSRLHLVAAAPKPVTVAAAIFAVSTSEAR